MYAILFIISFYEAVLVSLFKLLKFDLPDTIQVLLGVPKEMWEIFNYIRHIIFFLSWLYQINFWADYFGLIQGF